MVVETLSERELREVFVFSVAKKMDKHELLYSPK